MKKFKLTILFIFLILIIYFLLTIKISNFFRVYITQIFGFIFLYLILNFLIRKGRFILLVFILISSIFYFYIYPNYIEKRVIYSETLKEVSENNLLNINIDLDIGILNISSQNINEDFIFDYFSYKKVFLFRKIKNKESNYYFLQNPILKSMPYNLNEFNLILNDKKEIKLNVSSKSLFYNLDLSNCLLKKLNLKSSSSFIDMKLPENIENLSISFNLKPSYIKIGLRKNYYIEIKINSKNSQFNLIDLGFKNKNANEFYYNGGENKIFIDINSSSSYLNFYFLD